MHLLEGYIYYCKLQLCLLRMNLRSFHEVYIHLLYLFIYSFIYLFIYLSIYLLESYVIRLFVSNVNHID